MSQKSGAQLTGFVMTAEIGDLGVAVLRAVRATVDPDGVLNPGKLVADADR